MPISDRSDSTDEFDSRLRLYVYRHFIREGRAPSVREMAAALSSSVQKARAALRRLESSHAFGPQEDGELWRAAPFSAVPTGFPVRIGKRLWWGNCIWDALGIAALMRNDAEIDAACGCCNHRMPLRVEHRKLAGPKGIIHIAVPARHWYDDVVFT